MMMAASGHPRELQKKRDTISETRFSSHDHRLMNLEDDETTTVANVLKVKEILGSSDVSEAVLLESLLKLQQMVKSVNVLKLTGVGISVNRLRNHEWKLVGVISRFLVKEWKRMVDEWLKMQKLIKGGECESIQNPRNPPPTEAPITNQPRSLIVRIKLKKNDSEGSVIPDQKVDEVSDGTLKTVENINSSSMKTLKKPVPDERQKKVENISSSSVETGIGSSVKVVDQGSKETGRKMDLGNLKKRKIGDGVEEKVTWMKKYYVEEKKRRVQFISHDEQISLYRSSIQTKEPPRRRRRW